MIVVFVVFVMFVGLLVPVGSICLNILLVVRSLLLSKMVLRWLIVCELCELPTMIVIGSGRSRRYGSVS